MYKVIRHDNVKDFMKEKRGKYKFSYDDTSRVYNFGNGAVLCAYKFRDKKLDFRYFTDSTGVSSITKKEFKVQLKLRNSKVLRALYA